MELSILSLLMPTQCDQKQPANTLNVSKLPHLLAFELRYPSIPIHPLSSGIPPKKRLQTTILAYLVANSLALQLQWSLEEGSFSVPGFEQCHCQEPAHF